MIKVKIDGIETEVEQNITILEAAKSIGIDIPTLCYHKDLDPLGVCRVCLVEVEGYKNLVPSCIHKIDREIVIKTFSPKIKEAR